MTRGARRRFRSPLELAQAAHCDEQARKLGAKINAALPGTVHVRDSGGVVTKARTQLLRLKSTRGKQVEFGQTQVAGQALGVELQSVEVRAADDFDRAFSAISMSRPGALVTFTERLTIAHRQRIAEFAARNRLPMVAEIKEFAAAGGLMTYGPNEAWLSGRNAYYVDRILRGAKPADLPVEQPTRFEFVINRASRES
jgi:putative tryptophan/tyrosine transport system substrate-binding protein